MHVAARLAAYYFAFFAHAGAYVSYFALFLAGRGLTAYEIAVALAMPQAARIVAPALWGWLADAWGERYPDARRAVVVSSGFAMLAGVYDIASGNETFKAHLKKMITYCVAFTPDGQSLVIGNEKDNAARVVPLDAPVKK